MRTVNNILSEWLRANGFDGLSNLDYECGCELADLVPCGSDCSQCEPAYKRAHSNGLDFVMTTNRSQTFTDEEIEALL